MPAKDYYKILDIAHNASEQEVKRAYRQLAMKFHPDKNEGNRSAEASFREVLEAYEILSDPRRRSAYNQQRWYRQTSFRQPEHLPVTSYSILHKCGALNRYIETLDPFHINRQALNHYVVHLLSNAAVNVLRAEDNQATNQQIIRHVLRSIRSLPIGSVEKIALTLEKIAGDDKEALGLIHMHLKEKKSSYYWEKYLPLLILLITLLICILIYEISNN